MPPRKNKQKFTTRNLLDELEKQPGIYAISGEDAFGPIEGPRTHRQLTEGAPINLDASSRIKVGMSSKLGERLNSYHICYPRGFRIHGLLKINKKHAKAFEAAYVRFEMLN